MILILGAGITGLAAAFEATRLGVPVRLLDAAPRAGGLIRTEHVGGFVIDEGPDSLLAQKPAGVQLCEELGLASRLMTTSPPRTAFVYADGRLRPLPSPSVLGLPTTVRGMARYDLLSWRGRVRLALEPFVPPGPPRDESVAAFFRRRFGEETVARIAEPLLAGIHAGDVEALSVLSLFPRLVAAEQRPGRVLRSLAGQPRAPDGVFRALRGGMGELVETLLARLPGGALQVDTAAERLEAVEHGWRVSSRGRQFHASAVIVTLPSYAAAPLLTPLDARAGELCAGVPYVSTATVALGWPREAVSHPLAGSGFVVARTGPSPLRITACTWVSSKWEDRAPPGHVLLRVFLGGAHDPSVVHLPDRGLIQHARDDLRTTLGITAAPVLSRVSRTRRGGAQHHVGHAARMTELAGRLRTYRGLFAAGSGFEAIGIPDCIEHGRRAGAAAAEYVRSASGGVPPEW